MKKTNDELSSELDEKTDQTADEIIDDEDDTIDDADFQELDFGADEKTQRMEQNKMQNRKLNIVKEALSWVLTFALAIGLALLLKNYVIINATVPTGSMENTIMPGDDLFGFRLSYSFGNDPKRGDIVIFRFPDDESQKYVKRIVGLPGEKVTIVDAKVYINDSQEPLEESFLKEEWVRATGPFEFEVPEGCYFMMGDNRNDSYDSRYWVNTFVTRDQIIGKALFTYYPFDRFGALE